MEKTQMQENIEAQNTSRSFNLKFGYQDKQEAEVFHREITISRRPTGADIFKATANGTDDKNADFRINLSLIASSISKFGGIEMPVPITCLYGLNEIDEGKLNDEYLLFLLGTQPETEQKVLEDNRAQLSFGIERGGVKYQIVKFGNLINGFDRIEIQKEAQSDWEYIAFKMAREVVELSTLDGSNTISTSITFAEIQAMDLTDFVTMREAESAWLDSFRD